MEFSNLISYVTLVVTPFLFGIVTWFIWRMVNSNDDQHKEFKDEIGDFTALVEDKIKSLKSALMTHFQEVRDELKDHRKKLMEIQEEVVMINAKQERLDIFSTKIDAIHKMVDDNYVQDKKNKLEIEKKVFAVEVRMDGTDLKIKHLDKKLEDFDSKKSLNIRVKDILNSEHFSSIEKKEIETKIDDLGASPDNYIKLDSFIVFCESKIYHRQMEQAKKKPADPPEFETEEEDPKWRVSKNLIKDVEEEKKKYIK